MKKVLYFIVLVSSAIIYSGCDDTITVQDVDNREIPDSNVSFSKDISQIFCILWLTTLSGFLSPKVSNSQSHYQNHLI